MSIVYIEKPGQTHEPLINDTGADLVQYEFTVIGGLACVADAAIADGVRGSFHTEDALEIQIEDFVSGEDTFGTANAKVYWKSSTGEFSDTMTAGYYEVGTVTQVKNSNDVVWISKYREAFLVPAATIATLVADIATNTSDIATNVTDIGTNVTDIATNVTNIAAIKAMAGIPFHSVVTLTAAAAATPVSIVDATNVGAAEQVFITDLLVTVNGGTDWADATATIVTIQDSTTGTAGITLAKAGLTGNSNLGLLTANVTLGDSVALGAGFTVAEGIVIVADAIFGAGSDLVVTVSGYVK